jgi:two-component system nitrate/nitrite response regulator NarL
MYDYGGGHFMTKIIRVSILDDHQSIIDGYLFRLSQHSKFEVVSTAMYGEELEPLLAQHPTDILLLDVTVPTNKENANPYPILHLIPKLLELYPTLFILVISMHNTPSLIKAVMEAGASGYVLKDDTITLRELPSVLLTIMGGGIYLSQQAYEQIYKRVPKNVTLTARQLEVLALCAAYPDSSTAELAQRLGLANSTVRNLLSGAYIRLDVHSRAAAIAKAQQMGIILSPTVP